MDGWITVQLTDKGESTLDNEPLIIEEAIKKVTSQEFFIPVHYSKSKAYDNKIYLFTGYVFVKYAKSETLNFRKFVNTQYFASPLLVNKRLHLTPSNEIEKLKKELLKMAQPKIKVGDKVKVIDGKYKNLTAEVTEYYSDTKEADLTVTLKCMNIIVPKVPITCLAKEDSSNDPYAETIIKKESLQKRLIRLLEAHSDGLTRKDIVSKMDLTTNELKRISTNLSRSLKKGILDSFENSNGKSVFFIKK